MPGVDVAMGTIMVPIWAAGAASAVFVVALVLAIGRAGGAALIGALFRLALVVLCVYAGWIYLQRLAEQDRVAERRALDERAAALMTRAIATGSALSCLDELAGEEVETACEKAVFASPQAVAGAVSYVTAKLGLLTDATRLAERNDGAPASDLAPLRAALEIDRFGIVAHVLSGREGCTAEHCEGLTQLHDRSRVLANLRTHTFEEHVTQYSPGWKVAARPGLPGPEVTAATPQVPLMNSGPSPTPVASKYDFPSAQSIPPVSIMAPEPPPPRQSAAIVDSPSPAAGQIEVTPMPPRRPPQARAAPPRPVTARAQPQAAAPNTTGEAATATSADRVPPPPAR